MGGICSRNFNASHGVSTVNLYKSNGVDSKMTPPLVEKSMDKHKQEPVFSSHKTNTIHDGTNHDDIYDGIPRFTRTHSQPSRSVRSTQAAVAKVSEVSSLLGRAGTIGLEKAVEVLDTLGSSMTNLNPSSGFISVVGTKSNDLAILAFEVANTVVKGSNLMQSLSKESIIHLQEEVLPSEGVQSLVSEDMDELLRIFVADKSEELKIFAGEVVRFGNRSKDPQWHNLDRYFEKISRELTMEKQLKEDAESVMEKLTTLVHHTAELYHELQVLDRLEQDYQRKGEDDSLVGSQKGDSFAILKEELKTQRRLVKNIKKKSLWSRSLEEVMEKLVDIVHFLLLEISIAFGSSGIHMPVKSSVGNHQRLGPAGLALHYANIILQIDTLVVRSSSLLPNTRDALYQSLPPSVKSSLRSKLQSFQVKEEFTVTEIKDEMEKTLQWLVPIATNTAKAHHGFGWVGEWANTGSDSNRKPAAGLTDVIRVETLHHADKDKTEAFILDLVVWLHHLVNRAIIGAARNPIRTPLQKTNKRHLKQEPPSPPSLTVEDQEILQEVIRRKRIPGISKSEDFDKKSRLNKFDRLSKSSGHWPQRQSREFINVQRLPSQFPIFGFGIDKERALDAIDRVDMLR